MATCSIFLVVSFLSIFVKGEEWQTECRQIVVVVTPAWESTDGFLETFEKADSGWIPVGKPINVTVGRNGLGWGLGLHSSDRPGPIKREGDKRAPAGIFSLESGFGRKKLAIRDFDYRRTSRDDRWVDDPDSTHYNRWVKVGEVKKDWSSAEILSRPDGIYDHVIVVGHNRAPVVPGRGSAIFLHPWFGKGVSTIGCTAMARENVKSLLKWLDRDKRPVLVQIPDAELDSLDLPVDPAVVRRALKGSPLR